MPKAQICEEVGCSWSSLGRWARDEGIRVAFFNRYACNPQLVKQVCDYYAHHGKIKTEEKFPDVNIRSVIERYKNYEPRTIKWTDDQLIQVARFAGLIAMDDQWKYFDRPNAHRGSITSVWMKIFGIGGGQINGLAWYIAKHFVTSKCMPIRTAFWKSRHGKKVHSDGRQIVLWTDFKKHLKPDVPQWLKESADVMAKFQMWLHGSKNVRFEALAMIYMMEKQVI